MEIKYIVKSAQASGKDNVTIVCKPDGNSKVASNLNITLPKEDAKLYPVGTELLVTVKAN